MSTHEHQIEGIICKHVEQGTRPILQVIHHFDGMWEFSCASDDHPELDDFFGICGECTMARMEEYQMLKDLEVGQWANRNIEKPKEWSVFNLPPDSEE